jgi:hypothetical protein
VEPDRCTELYRRHHRAVWAYAPRPRVREWATTLTPTPDPRLPVY